MLITVLQHIQPDSRNEVAPISLAEGLMGFYLIPSDNSNDLLSQRQGSEISYHCY